MLFATRCLHIWGWTRDFGEGRYTCIVKVQYKYSTVPPGQSESRRGARTQCSHGPLPSLLSPVDASPPAPLQAAPPSAARVLGEVGGASRQRRQGEWERGPGGRRERQQGPRFRHDIDSRRAPAPPPVGDSRPASPPLPGARCPLPPGAPVRRWRSRWATHAPWRSPAWQLALFQGWRSRCATHAPWRTPPRVPSRSCRARDCG